MQAGQELPIALLIQTTHQKQSPKFFHEEAKKYIYPYTIFLNSSINCFQMRLKLVIKNP